MSAATERAKEDLLLAARAFGWAMGEEKLNGVAARAHVRVRLLLAADAYTAAIDAEYKRKSPWRPSSVKRGAP